MSLQQSDVMMKFFSIIALAAAVAAAAQADVYEYEPGAFDKLVVRADIDVVYRNVPDSTGYIRYESDRDFSKKLDVSCSKGKLVIVDKMTDEDYGKLPTLYLYSDYLVSVSYEGTGYADIELQSATPSFSAKLTGNGRVVCTGINTTDFSANIVTGNGTIVARGKCRKAKFTLTGTGVIQADGLVADAVSCSVLGTGSIGCRPLDTLDVRGVGSTKIYYYGDPKIKKMGGAKLERMASDDDPQPIGERRQASAAKQLPVGEREPDEEWTDESED